MPTRLISGVLMAHLVCFITPDCSKNTEGLGSWHRLRPCLRSHNMHRIAAASLAIAAAALVPAPAQSQTWPAKPVRIVNTFAPGGAADFLCRTVADGMAAAFGHPFFVETRAGAAGQLGIQAVINTPPDGYNFVLTNITMLVFAPITNPKLGYNPHKDLSNIAYIGGSPIVLSVNA